MRGIDNFIEGKLGSVGSKSRASNTPPRVIGLRINNMKRKNKIIDNLLRIKLGHVS